MAKSNRSKAKTAPKQAYHTLTLPDGQVVKVTKMQGEFARLYAVTGDATNSRLEAGYAHVEGLNRQEAYKLLQNVKVQLAVEYYKAQAAKKLDISENRLLAEMAAMGFSNVANLYHENGHLKNLQEMDKASQRAIKKVKSKRYMERNGPDQDDYEEVEIIEVEMHPKLPALTKIAEIKGMAAPKDPNLQRPVTVNVSVNGTDAKVHES